VLSQAVRIRSAADLHDSDAEVDRLEHEQLKSIYRGLLMKREHAVMSANLERRQIGEQFKLVDSPRVAETPISPNRPLIAGQGAVAGFLLGVTMMWAARNGSFRRLERARARS
jgi:uncharacterized protein involved in exopolysaccharide biosynthesis